MEPLTILTSLLPSVGKTLGGLGEALVRRVLPQEDRPKTFAEHLEQQKLDVERLRVIAELESGGDSYPWVEAVRKLQRPFFVAVIAASYIYYMGGITADDVANLTSSVVFYLFGDRSFQYYQQTKAKNK